MAAAACPLGGMPGAACRGQRRLRADAAASDWQFGIRTRVRKCSRSESGSTGGPGRTGKAGLVTSKEPDLRRVPVRARRHSIPYRLFRVVPVQETGSRPRPRTPASFRGRRLWGGRRRPGSGCSETSAVPADPTPPAPRTPPRLRPAVHGRGRATEGAA